MRVAVAGAGIAGLTAAIALARRGIVVEVFERAPALQEIGAGIQLSPNAVAVLERLDLLSGLQKWVSEPSAIDIRDARTGRRLASIPLGETVRRRHGLPFYVIHRADLQARLIEAAERAGVEIHLDAAIRDVRQPTNGVDFVAGETEHRAEVLVAADGVHSALRKDVFGYPGARSLGRVAWRAIIPVDQTPASVDRTTTGLWIGPGIHLVHYPVSGGRNLNLVVIAAADRHAPLPPKHLFGSEAAGLLDTVPSWSAYDLFVVDAALPWVSGRVVLLGDAAHAMAPSAAQGGAQAIEDGWAIAAMLADKAAGVGASLSAYERARRPRVEWVIRAANRNLSLYEMQGLAAAGRNLGLGVLPASFLLSRLDRLFRWRPG